jgi:hypothetical protein
MKRSFRDLFVWQASVDLAVRLIGIADVLIAARRFALAGRFTTKDRRHYLVQARGSLYEVDTQLEILTRARLVQDVKALRDIIARLECGLTRMIDRLKDP